MIDAHVYKNPDGEYMVSLRLAGEQFDEAGPFDDETDAVQMAQRNADTVSVTFAGGPLNPESAYSAGFELEAA